MYVLWLEGRSYEKYYQNPTTSQTTMRRNRKNGSVCLFWEDCLEILARELQQFGYRTGFYPATTVRNLSTLKDPVPAGKKSGVYRITCGECSSDVYIGQTGRQFNKRLTEHKKQIRNDDDPASESAVALHCYRTGHDRTRISGRLLHTCKKGKQMNRLEEVETISASVSLPDDLLLNDLNSTFFNPFVRYFFGANPTNRENSPQPALLN